MQSIPMERYILTNLAARVALHAQVYTPFLPMLVESGGIMLSKEQISSVVFDRIYFSKVAIPWSQHHQLSHHKPY